MKYINELALVLMIVFGSCTKYLDAVPDSGLAVPRTGADFQQLLESERMFNNAPGIGEFGTDDLYLPDALLASQTVAMRNGYVWAKDIYEGATSANWNNMFLKTYYANIVLEGVAGLKDGTISSMDLAGLKGWALFCRAHAFYDLVQVFGQPYRQSTAGSDLGIPLRLNTNLSEITPRANIADTYARIIKDLDEAIPMLPDAFPKNNRNRPCKAAGYALLARLYLNMQNYTAALKNAESSLNLYNTLLDYNGISTTARLSFSPLVDEVIYLSVQLSYSHQNWQVDRGLYNSFAVNDLRKVLFFTENTVANTVVFKGFYSAVSTAFNGLTTDEVYLLKAECEARLMMENGALETLNALLINRYKKGTYVPYSVNNTSDVLGLVLTERRKELIFRNLRWSDLRRLNQDPRFAKTINRTANGIAYVLPPNDPRYVLPIPDDEIRNSGIEQNIR